MIKTIKMTQWDINQTVSVDSPAQALIQEENKLPETEEVEAN